MEVKSRGEGILSEMYSPRCYRVSLSQAIIGEWKRVNELEGQGKRERLMLGKTVGPDFWVGELGQKVGNKLHLEFPATFIAQEGTQTSIGMYLRGRT
jgi:hypothetical protein